MVQPASPCARCYLLYVQICLSSGVRETTDSCTKCLLNLFGSVGKYIWMRICIILHAYHMACARPECEWAVPIQQSSHQIYTRLRHSLLFWCAPCNVILCVLLQKLSQCTTYLYVHACMCVCVCARARMSVCVRYMCVCART